MMKEAIAKVVAGTDLSEAEMVGVMETIMDGEATPAQIGAFITALRIKGETVDEITGAARVMRAKATKVHGVGEGGILVDTCGTGGDASGTFNVSTTSAFVVAAAGVPVAKHGNRSVSSHCGSADVLEALGVDLGLSAEQIGQSIREIGIGFMFAPALHGAMKHAIGPRREIGIRTIFNILGPLTNPANANVQLMGVFTPSLTETLARVLGRLGTRRALVVCGEGNLDEITITGATRVSDWNNGELTTYTIHPSELGMATASLAEIKGGTTAPEAAAQLRSVLSGKSGPCLDMVLLNAGAALMAAERCDDLAGGVALAREVVASGAALNKVEALVAFSQAVKNP
ncbi:anthranilate phosphoribosyltransferase [Thiovibrio frasassiensis]|uniref:Anthranilate phosphoribosyltransferase n=1 Tax=Thiovibrio frasassiensis TaxID=2984131 RepID=A0A9X4MBM0_9BACT|nr:anthranilate phosphoribosyltransferase [Thiovibrio frasassiensis]MDG4474599.1 anthranilate phosphoribosyltransferase [Thiovibrio frasassiensis]